MSGRVDYFRAVPLRELYYLPLFKPSLLWVQILPLDASSVLFELHYALAFFKTFRQPCLESALYVFINSVLFLKSVIHGMVAVIFFIPEMYREIIYLRHIASVLQHVVLFSFRSFAFVLTNDISGVKSHNVFFHIFVPFIHIVFL